MEAHCQLVDQRSMVLGSDEHRKTRVDLGTSEVEEMHLQCSHASVLISN